MHSQLKSVSVMATSNSKLFLSDKDLNADPAAAAVDLKLISKQAADGKNKNKRKRKTTDVVDVASLKVPSLGLEKRFKVNDENRKDEDGARTPTSSDYKIPAIRRCPLAPRKPKSLKRALPVPVQRGIAVGFDLAKDYLESMFPPTPPSKKKLFAPAAAVPSSLDGAGRSNKCLQLSP